MQESQSEKIRQILGRVRPEGIVLDLASGPGFLERFIKAVAIDIDLGNLKKAKGPKVLGDAHALPFSSGSFGTVFAIDIAHLLKKADELERVLRPGGLLVASIFCNRYNAGEKADWLKGRFNRMEIKEQFIAKAEQEWDAVIVCRKPSSPARNARSAGSR
jgi:SAM-dependent methyltransferase